MALPGRPAPLAPIRPLPGDTPTVTIEDVNHLVVELNAHFDAVWRALAALDTRLAALE